MKIFLVLVLSSLFVISNVLGQVAISSILPGVKTWDFGAPESVSLLPGFEYKPEETNYFIGHIAQENLSFELLTPEINNIKRYEKVEFGIKLPTYIESLIQQFRSEPYFLTGLNPYDPHNIDLYALFTSPTGKTIRANAFFYIDYDRKSDCKCNVKDCGEQFFPCWIEKPTEYKWRIRFAPQEIGNWSVSYYLNINSSFLPICSITDAFQFQCAESDNKGYLYASGTNFRYSKTQEIFKPIGFNIEWGNMYDNLHAFEIYNNYFTAIHDNGGNLASFSLINFLGLQFEWENLGIYESSNVTINHPYTQNNRQAHAWEIDNILNSAREKGIFLKYTILQHPELSSENDDFWPENPYLEVLQEDATPIDFMNNNVTITSFQNKLRYLIARWGYSTNIAWWELLTEIDKIYNFEGHEVEVKTWFDIMAEKIKTFDYSAHMISGSYSKTFNNDDNDRINNWIWRGDNCDFINIHNYSYNKKQNFDRFNDVDKIQNTYDLDNKPILFGEMGTTSQPPVDSATDLQFHNNIWATNFMGTAGSGINWFWDKMIPKGFCSNFKSLKDFNNLVDYNKNYEPQQFPKNWILPSQNPSPVYWWINYLVESFYLIETNKNSAIGWFNNASHYWYNIGLEPLYFDDGNEIKLEYCPLTLCEHPGDDIYDEPTICPSDELHISGLKLAKKYDFAPYQIGIDSLMPHTTITKRTSLTGKFKINTFNYFIFSHDFAFTLTRHNQKERKTYLEPDTVGCQSDTIYFEGMYEDDTLGILSYKWDFGNGNTSNLIHPRIVYNYPGSYPVTLIVSDTFNLVSDTLRQTFVVLNCDTNRQLKSPIYPKVVANQKYNPSENKKNIQIYPNPSKGIFYVTGLPCKSMIISIYNIKGGQIVNKNITFNGTFELDLSNCSPGMYMAVVDDRIEKHRFKLILLK